ncbi:hypothetical protein D3C80_853570 [compost metagenome]
MHPLAHLLKCFLSTCRLVFGANTGSNITIQIKPTQKWRVTIDMASLKCFELRHAFGIFGENAWKIHEFGQSNDLGMIGKRLQIVDQKFCTRGFHMCCRHAARELNANIHDGFKRTIEKILQAFRTQHISNFMRITDDSGYTLRQYTTVELMRRDMRGLDM